MKKNRFFIFVFLPTIAVCAIAFWIRGVLLLDPDFGWHLKLGELIIKHGFPKTDPFSYSMPSYPFVDYEWGSNVLIYLGYIAIGGLGLAAVYGLLAVWALWLAAGKKDMYSPIPILFGAAVMLGTVGVRPQVISWFFLAMLVKLIGEKKVWRKWKWTFPLLMILWVNFHGSFPIGLLIASLMLILKWFQEKKINSQDVAILLLGIVAVLVNPYGLRDGYEVVRQMLLGGKLMRTQIQEWMPWYAAPTMSFWILVGLGCFFYFRYWKRMNWGEMGAGVMLAIAGAASMRNMPLFGIAVTPLVNRGFKDLEAEAKSVGAEERFAFFIKLLIVFSIIVFIGEGALALVRARQLSEDRSYPKKAVEFLKGKNYSGRLFSEYGWGGYLIWKYPEKKVYIDGRMSNFVWRAPVGETDYVFREYLELNEGKQTIAEVFQRYRVETVLWPTQDAEESKIKKLFSRFLGRGSGQKKNFLKRLEEAGWVRVYKDQLAVVFRKSGD